MEQEFIPGLPEEIALECLTRLPYTTHRVASRVCRRWKHLFQSHDFYHHRKQSQQTHKVACLVHSLPVQPGRKSVQPPSYGIIVFDPASGCWDRLHPIPKYLNGLPLFCQLSSVEGKLVVMGGWDPTSWEPVKDVFVYDFVTQRWNQGKDMPSKRSFFACAAAASASNGCVFVAGGHDESKNALKSAWKYDLKRNEWSELTQMSEERDECEGLVVKKEFWVVSGYGTERQGRFESSVEAYEVETGRVRRIEGKWVQGKCPRGSLGIGKDGELMRWGDLVEGVGVGSCVVDLGEKVVVTGSGYQGGPQGFVLVEMKEGQMGKLGRIDVPEEFCGFVQSGSCVEI